MYSINQLISQKLFHSGLSGNRRCKDHWAVILGKDLGRKNKTGEV